MNFTVNAPRKRFEVTRPARDFIFVLMLVSVVCFIASTPRTAGVDPSGVFPTRAQLEMFSASHPLLVRSALLLLGAVFLLGVSVCLFQLVLWVSSLPAGKGTGLSAWNLSPASWSVWDVARGGILFLYAGTVLAVLNPLPAGRESAFIAYNFIAQGVAVLYLCSLVPGGAGAALSAIGLRAGHLLRRAAAGAAAYVGFVPVFVVLVLASTMLGRLAGIELKPQRHLLLFTAPRSAAGYVFLAAFVGFIAPLLEEIFFRGFLYGAFKRRWGVLPAVLSSALIFSLLHVNIGTLLPIFGLGVLLAYIRERTGSLVAPIVVHVLQNSIAVSAVFILLWIKNNC